MFVKVVQYLSKHRNGAWLQCCVRPTSALVKDQCLPSEQGDGHHDKNNTTIHAVGNAVPGKSRIEACVRAVPAV